MNGGCMNAEANKFLSDSDERALLAGFESLFTEQEQRLLLPLVRAAAALGAHNAVLMLAKPKAGVQ